jgi:hypothetical protein
MRRFPLRWIHRGTQQRTFIVRDANGQALGYFYFEDEPGRRAAAKSADPRRGAAHGGELRQAAGRVEAAISARTREPHRRCIDMATDYGAWICSLHRRAFLDQY